jgi:hypothetical protein
MKDILLGIAGVTAIGILVITFLGFFLVIGVPMYRQGVCELQGKTELWCWETYNGMTQLAPEYPQSN